jgi:hypothetical protein
MLEKTLGLTVQEREISDAVGRASGLIWERNDWRGTPGASCANFVLKYSRKDPNRSNRLDEIEIP